MPIPDLARLVPEDVFRFVLELESHKAIRLQYCVSVVVLAADGVSGAPPAEPALLARRLAGGFVGQVRSTDLVTLLCSSLHVGVLLIDAHTQALPAVVGRAVRALMPEPATAEMVWSAGGACFPETVKRPEELVTRAEQLMSQARKDGRGRIYAE